MSGTSSSQAPSQERASGRALDRAPVRSVASTKHVVHTWRHAVRSFEHKTSLAAFVVMALVYLTLVLKNLA